MSTSNSDVKVPEDEEKQPQARDQWNGKLDFLLSCLSLAVGLGNIWRFPFMCFKNGGAVFLIPYFIMLIFVGLPLFYMELCLGQFSSKSSIEVWAAVPLLKGIGYAMVFNSFFQAIYYVVLIAWALYYIFASMTSVLPWSSCRHGIGTWATEDCFSTVDAEFCHESLPNSTYFNGTCQNTTDAFLNFQNSSRHGRISPTEEYFNNELLHLSKDTEDIGTIHWKLALCLLLAWFIIYLCMIKGSKSFGKVAYFTATFPYLVLTIMLVKGAMLDGAAQGVLFYIVPDFSRLADSVVWFDAASQIFYSLGCGLGCLTTFASFNDFKKNNKKDTFIVALGNSLTSVYAGFAIFCILGFIAYDTGVSVKDVASDGSGLAFIAYPQAVARLPVSQLWSILFFFMVLSLGTGTLFGPVEVIMTAMQDHWPSLRKYKVSLLAALILIMFLIGLTMTTQIGLYIFTIINDYNAYALVITSLVELIAISYIYGFRRLTKDVEFMLDDKLGIYWKFTWGVSAPVLTLAVVIFSFVLYHPSEYAHKALPTWLNALGWTIVAISLSPIVICAVQGLLKNKKDWSILLRPSENWHPAAEQHKAMYLKLHLEESLKNNEVPAVTTQF